jgi:hypothetical protein
MRAGKETAGFSTPLRSGQDDNSVGRKWPQTWSDEWLSMVPQNCHPDRSVAEGPAVSLPALTQTLKRTT